MKRYIIGAFILPSALALLPDCKRKAPSDVAEVKGDAQSETKAEIPDRHC